ncbi:MAG: hypothetical protein ACRERU_15235 [Methylococcales bacterium]
MQNLVRPERVRDEERYYFGPAQRLAEALKRRGVPAELIEEAVREAAP